MVVVDGEVAGHFEATGYVAVEAVEGEAVKFVSCGMQCKWEGN